MKSSNELDNLVTMAYAGQSARHWYSEARETAHTLAGPRAPRLLSLLAATSPRMTVARNVVAACELLLWGESTTAMRSHLPNVARAFAGAELSGPKVSAFNANLQGDETIATVDIHMFRLFGYEPRARNLPLVASGIELVACALGNGWTVAQTQASLWHAQRGDAGRNGASYASELPRTFGRLVTTLEVQK